MLIYIYTQLDEISKFLNVGIYDDDGFIDEKIMPNS